MNAFEMLSDLHGPTYIGFYLMAVAMAAMVAYMVRHYLLDRDKLADRYSESDLAPLAASLDPYEVAYLLGGPERVLTAALASLSARNAIEIGSSKVTLKQNAATASKTLTLSSWTSSANWPKAPCLVHSSERVCVIRV